MDKVLQKRNCLTIIGASNAGKTVVVAQPLIDIARYVGRVSNVNIGSSFAWQDCVNVRIISIEEALFAPEQLDKFKQISGGEECVVDKKFSAAVTVPRTPVILTANNDPWRTAPEQRSALLNRTFYHSVIACDWLKYMTKPLNPAIYHFLLAYAQRTWQGTIPTVYIPFTFDLEELLEDIKNWTPPKLDIPSFDNLDDSSEIEEPAAKKQCLVTTCEFD